MGTDYGIVNNRAINRRLTARFLLFHKFLNIAFLVIMEPYQVGSAA